MNLGMWRHKVLMSFISSPYLYAPMSLCPVTGVMVTSRLPWIHLLGTHVFNWEVWVVAAIYRWKWPCGLFWWKKLYAYVCLCIYIDVSLCVPPAAWTQRWLSPMPSFFLRSAKSKGDINPQMAASFQISLYLNLLFLGPKFWTETKWTPSKISSAAKWILRVLREEHIPADNWI